MIKSNIKNKSQKNNDADTDDDEMLNDYQSALMTSLMALKNPQKIPDVKPTECRIEFVKNLLDEKKLKPMVDFNSCDTESSTSTRLNKRIIDVKKFFASMNVKLRYLKSGTTGHTFKATSKTDENIAFAVKVCAYPKDGYGSMHNLTRPENVELRMIKLLSYFVVKRVTPHLVLPIGTFNSSIIDFIKIPQNVINLDDEKNETYKKFVDKYHDGEFEDFVSILISEWCNGGDLLDYIRKNHEQMTLKQWIVIFFQILFTLALIHEKYPQFRHNDLKANNVLVRITDIKQNNSNRNYRYNIGNTKFIIPNINLQVGIWDFDFACIGNLIENSKVNADWTKKINITNKENKYYDMHYFFNTLISKRFFPQFYEGGVPPQIVEFIHRIIPEKYRNGSNKIHKRGRILVNDEYLTPYKVIMEDPLFEKYRYHGDKINFQ